VCQARVTNFQPVYDYCITAYYTGVQSNDDVMWTIYRWNAGVLHRCAV